MKTSLAIMGVILMSSICHAAQPSEKPKDFPASPLKKPGWTLVVNDEFDGPELDETLWIPEYCPGRFAPPRPAHYYFKDGAIHLHVNSPDAKEFVNYSAVSSLQTFTCPGFAGNKTDKTIDKFTQLYGWYEIRAMHVGPMHHIAFWTEEARPAILGKDQGEIDVIEGPAWPCPNFHFPAKRKTIKKYKDITSKKQRATEFHLYTLEIFETGVRIYHDNQLIEEAEVNWKKRKEVPMMFFLSIYGTKNKALSNEKQEYVIDYFRAYKKLREDDQQNKPDAGDE